MGTTALLGEWASGAPNTWSNAAMRDAKRAFIDTVGCMLAGSDDAAVDAVHRVARGLGAGGSTVIGRSGLLPGYWAAFVNGTSAHALDYDDCLDPAMSHPSAPMVPALLALAEETHATGAACLDAYLVGFEIMARLGEGLNLAHYYNGWHTTLSLGAMGVAAACARLLGLDARRTTMAIGLASSMAGGSKRQFGSMAKPVHAGLAAKNGLLAARLAENGVTSADEVLEGRWGMVEMTGGVDAPGFDRVSSRIGQPSAMEQYGVWLKRYPCCASTHRPIETAFALHDQGFRAEDVDRIAILVSANAAANLRFRHPSNVMEARFSLPYCVAVALLQRAVKLRDFTPEAIGRPEVAALIDRIEMSVDPDLDGTASVGEAQERATAKATIKGLVTPVEIVVDAPSGHASNPLSDSQLEEKFLDCASRVLSEARAAEMLRSLAMFETLPGIATLMRLTRKDDDPDCEV